MKTTLTIAIILVAATGFAQKVSKKERETQITLLEQQVNQKRTEKGLPTLRFKKGLVVSRNYGYITTPSKVYLRMPTYWESCPETDKQMTKKEEKQCKLMPVDFDLMVEVDKYPSLLLRKGYGTAKVSQRRNGDMFVILK
jgi:hypothetical protein